MDFFLWGHLKYQVYVYRPENVQDLMDRVRQEANALTLDMIQNSVSLSKVSEIVMNESIYGYGKHLSEWFHQKQIHNY